MLTQQTERLWESATNWQACQLKTLFAKTPLPPCAWGSYPNLRARLSAHFLPMCERSPHLELFKPKYPPPPQTQILPKLKQAQSWGRGGEKSARPGRLSLSLPPTLHFRFNFWGTRINLSLAIGQTLHIFLINRGRTGGLRFHAAGVCRTERGKHYHLRSRLPRGP